MNKGIKVLLIVLSVVFTLVLAVSSILFIFKVGILTGTSTKLIDEKEFDKIQDISINTNIGDVYIRYSSNDKFKTEIFSDRVINSYIKLDNNNMVVQLEDRNWFSLFNKTPRIIIYVPKNFENEIEIKTTTGDVRTVDYLNTKFNINVTTGNISLGKVKNAEITCTTGNVRIKDIKEGFNINTTTGDVNIQNINITKNSYITTTTGDIKVNNNNNNIYVDTTTRTGDIRINNNNRHSSIELKVKTTTGDITIN